MLRIEFKFRWGAVMSWRCWVIKMQEWMGVARPMGRYYKWHWSTCPLVFTKVKVKKGSGWMEGKPQYLRAGFLNIAKVSLERQRLPWSTLEYTGSMESLQIPLSNGSGACWILCERSSDILMYWKVLFKQHFFWHGA